MLLICCDDLHRSFGSVVWPAVVFAPFICFIMNRAEYVGRRMQRERRVPPLFTVPIPEPEFVRTTRRCVGCMSVAPPGFLPSDKTLSFRGFCVGCERINRIQTLLSRLNNEEHAFATADRMLSVVEAFLNEAVTQQPELARWVVDLSFDISVLPPPDWPADQPYPLLGNACEEVSPGSVSIPELLLPALPADVPPSEPEVTPSSSSSSEAPPSHGTHSEVTEVPPSEESQYSEWPPPDYDWGLPVFGLPASMVLPGSWESLSQAPVPSATPFTETF